MVNRFEKRMVDVILTKNTKRYFTVEATLVSKLLVRGFNGNLLLVDQNDCAAAGKGFHVEDFIRIVQIHLASGHGGYNVSVALFDNENSAKAIRLFIHDIIDSVCAEAKVDKILIPLYKEAITKDKVRAGYEVFAKLLYVERD